MGFSCGLVGLPNAGKSTLFNALTAAGALVAAYPFATIEPKEGIVAIPDERLEKLASILAPPKVTPAVLTVVDIAGLVQGAHRGEGLGNQFLANIREMDAIIHVVRFFKDVNVSHPTPKLDPIHDFDAVITELLLADLETVQKRRKKLTKIAKHGDKTTKSEIALLEKLEHNLNHGVLASKVQLTQQEKQLLDRLFLLTAKPAMTVANIDEDSLPQAEEVVAQLTEYLAKMHIPVIPVAAKLEMELTQLPDPKERKQFMESLGLKQSALTKVITTGYNLLNLVTFYTTVGKELRAWTVTKGTPAYKAAGKIHTDMEKGFIKAEVASFDEFVKSGSYAAARTSGTIRIEGKDYAIQDGDVVLFRFK